MSDGDLEKISPPPDPKPDNGTEQEIRRTDLEEQKDELQARRALRVPVLIFLLLLVCVAILVLVASGIDSLHFHPNPQVLTAFIVGAFGTCLVVALKWLFK